MFDLTSVEDVTENYHYPELFREPLRPNYTSPLEHITELFVFGVRMSLVKVTNLLGRISKTHKVSPQQIINRIPLRKYKYLGSFPSDYAQILPEETFVIINTPPTIMRGEHWIMIENSRQKMDFADSLGREK